MQTWEVHVQWGNKFQEEKQHIHFLISSSWVHIFLCVNIRPRVTTDIRGFLRDCGGVGLTKGHTRGMGD